MQQFTSDNFHLLCNELAEKDLVFKTILQQHSYPPMWTRKASFATLIHIVLEQQVSLASARAAFNKLKEKIGLITPAKLLQLSDEELRACYFSRQKNSVCAPFGQKHSFQRKFNSINFTASHDDEVRGILKTG